jgi:hypothetical protein
MTVSMLPQRIGEEGFHHHGTTGTTSLSVQWLGGEGLSGGLGAHDLTRAFELHRGHVFVGGGFLGEDGGGE